jgi:hypothetical protein
MTKKPRKLTEREAWLYLAGAWGRVAYVNFDAWAAKVAGSSCFGLCASIACLAHAGKVTDTTRRLMMKRIDDEHGKCGTRRGGYLWSLSESSAEARVSFCLRMAEYLAPKRKKAKV